jgi:hypothetical protein
MTHCCWVDEEGNVCSVGFANGWILGAPLLRRAGKDSWEE